MNDEWENLKATIIEINAWTSGQDDVVLTNDGVYFEIMEDTPEFVKAAFWASWEHQLLRERIRKELNGY